MRKILAIFLLIPAQLFIFFATLIWPDALDWYLERYVVALQNYINSRQS